MICRTCKSQVSSISPSCPICGTLQEDSSLTLEARDDAPVDRLPVGAKLQNGSYSAGRLLLRDELGCYYLGSDSRKRRPVLLSEFFPVGCARKGDSVVGGGHWDSDSYRAARDEFHQCGEQLVALRHRNLEPVIDNFREHNTSYRVALLQPSRSLADAYPWLARAGSHDAPALENQAVELGEQLAAALQVAHGASLVHGSLNPGSIFYAPDGSVILCGFGRGPAFAQQQPRHAASSPYVAPEQWTTGAISPLADLYSLAALLYHLLTGQPPTPADERGASAELFEVRRLRPEIKAHVGAAIMDSLALEPSRRPSSVQEFAARLRQSPRPAPPTQRPAPTPGVLPPVAQSPAPGSPWPQPWTPAGEPSAWHAPPPPVGPNQAQQPAQADPQHQAPQYQGGAANPRIKVPGFKKSPLATPAYSAPAGQPALPAPSKQAGPSPPPLASKQEPAPKVRIRVPGGRVHGCAFSSDSTELMTVGVDRTARVWKVAGGALQQTITLKCKDGTPPKSMAVSHDGEMIAGGYEDGKVRLWETASGNLMHTLIGPAGIINSLAFSSDGVWLAAGSGDSSVAMWETEKGEHLQTMGDGAFAVTHVAFSPDDKWLAAGTDTGIIQLWNAWTEELEWSQDGHDFWITALAFTPNTSAVISASYDRKVRFWAVQLGMEVQSLNGHESGITSLAVATQGRLLASGSLDTTVRLWDAWSGDLRHTLSAHGDSVHAVLFSPDSSALATISEEQIVIWR